MVRSLLPNHVVLSSVLGHDTYSLKPTKAMYGFGGQTETYVWACVPAGVRTDVHACMHVCACAYV